LRTIEPAARLLVHPLADDRAGRDRPCASFASVPRHWIWTQVAIMLFLIASVVIAITRLA
jgi:hypothetical protein